MTLLKICELVFCVCVVEYTAGALSEENVDCSTCVARVQTFVDHVRNEMTLVDNLDPVETCKLAPLEFRSLCQELLSTFENGVSMDLKESHMELLCKMASQCGTRTPIRSDSKDLVFDSEIDSDMFDLGSDVESMQCLLCDNFMKIAQSYLRNKQHQAALFRMVKGACRFLPVFQNKCHKLVAQYGWLIIHVASQWVNPELCKLFHICPSNFASSQHSCKLCEFSVGIIQDSLEDPAIEARLTEAMEQLCEDLGNDKEECKELTSNLNEFLPGVIKTMREQGELSTLCQNAGICSAADLSHSESNASDESDDSMDQWTMENPDEY